MAGASLPPVDTPQAGVPPVSLLADPDSMARSPSTLAGSVSVTDTCGAPVLATENATLVQEELTNHPTVRVLATLAQLVRLLPVLEPVHALLVVPGATPSTNTSVPAVRPVHTATAADVQDVRLEDIAAVVAPEIVMAVLQESTILTPAKAAATIARMRMCPLAMQPIAQLVAPESIRPAPQAAVPAQLVTTAQVAPTLDAPSAMATHTLPLVRRDAPHVPLVSTATAAHLVTVVPPASTQALVADAQIAKLVSITPIHQEALATAAVLVGMPLVALALVRLVEVVTTILTVVTAGATHAPPVHLPVVALPLAATVLLVNTPVRVLLATAVLQESTPERGGPIATTARLVDTPVVPEGPIRVPHVLRASTSPELAREVA